MLARNARHHANGFKTTLRSGDESTDAEARDDVTLRMVRANSLPPVRTPKTKRTKVVLEKMAALNPTDESSDVASETSGVERRRRSTRHRAHDVAEVTSHDARGEREGSRRLKKRRSSVGVVSNDGSMRRGSRSRDSNRDVINDYANMTADDAARIDISKYYTPAQSAPGEDAARAPVLEQGSRRKRHSRRRAGAPNVPAEARDASRVLNDVTDATQVKADVALALETYRSREDDSERVDRSDVSASKRRTNNSTNTYML